MLPIKNCRVVDPSRAFYGVVDLEILETKEGYTGTLHWSGYDLPLSNQRQYHLVHDNLGELPIRMTEDTNRTSRRAEFVVRL